MLLSLGQNIAEYWTGSDMISFNVKNYWINLKVTWVCGYGLWVCMNMMYYVYSWGVARLTKDLSGGVIQGSDVGGLYWFSGQEEGEK